MATWPTGLATTWAPSMALAYTRMQDFSDAAWYLFNSRPIAAIKRDNGAIYTTTSTSFVDVDATNLIHTVTLAGTKVLITFAGACLADGVSNPRVIFDVLINGARYASAGTEGIVGILQAGSAPAPYNVSFAIIVTGLTPGSNTFKLQWKVGSNTGRLASGDGVAGQDYIPSFSVAEIG